MSQIPQKFSAKIKIEVQYNYLLHLPKGYDEKSSKGWPAILFLHGLGERGNDVNFLKNTGLPEYIEDKEDFPFIVISPQCPDGKWWSNEIDNLKLFFSKTIKNLNADTDRLYLTGLSMGGFGTWYMAMAYPEIFAAIVPICGGGLSWNGEALKNVPIWAFHGALDKVVAPDESTKMVNVVNQCGGNAKLTIYPDLDHDSWTATYNNLKLYKWLLSHKK